MKYRQDVLVKCPYYKGEDKQVLFCEGVQEGTKLHLAFDTVPNIKEYKKQFCKGCYNRCIVADAMNRKWGYDGK